jgi:hypothetical protein
MLSAPRWRKLVERAMQRKHSGAVDGIWHYRSGARTPFHRAVRWLAAAAMGVAMLAGAVVAAADWLAR